MPRSCSISIQSEITPLRSPLPWTAPAEVIASVCSASASVSVDLPASGWEITANVRRRAASRLTSLAPVEVCAATDTTFFSCSRVLSEAIPPA